jgi:hypothetical protein
VVRVSFEGERKRKRSTNIAHGIAVFGERSIEVVVEERSASQEEIYIQRSVSSLDRSLKMLQFYFFITHGVVSGFA